MRTKTTRLLGAATALYGAGLTARPQILTRPCGLTRGGEPVPPGTAALTGALGARDTVIGLAMLLAPAGPALRTALVCRVLADAGDAALFGTLLPDRTARVKAATVAGAWGLLCAVSGLRGRGAPERRAAP